jgi:hypothetical protein
VNRGGNPHETANRPQPDEKCFLFEQDPKCVTPTARQQDGFRPRQEMRKCDLDHESSRSEGKTAAGTMISERRPILGTMLAPRSIAVNDASETLNAVGRALTEPRRRSTTSPDSKTVSRSNSWLARSVSTDVATALWAVFPRSRATRKTDRPQAGGYIFSVRLLTPMRPKRGPSR